VPLLSPAEADETEPCVLRGLLQEADMRALEALGARLDAAAEGGGRAAAEGADGAAEGAGGGAAGGGCGGEGGGSGDGGDGGGVDAGGGGGGDAAGGGGEAFAAGFSLFGGEGDEIDVVALAEEAWHQDGQHRLTYLHRDGALEGQLPRLLARVLAAMRAADAARWRLLVRRPHAVRSAELVCRLRGSNASGVGGSPALGLLQPTGSCPPLPGQHAYTVGGSVADPGHRDQGSLLTLSVLLSEPGSYEGGQLTTAGGRVHELRRGDGVLFVSEQRHNVSTLEAGVRRSFVVELWGRPPNARNRHC
jgi:hypothetical protein